MAYFHGIRVNEVDTALTATVSTSAGMPVVFGTAPIHLTDDPKKYVNQPFKAYSWDEATKALGYSANWEKYTLCEVMYSQFKLYGVSPTIFVNVLDPTKHKKSVTDAEGRPVNSKIVTVSDPVLLNTLKVRSEASAEPAVLDTDYTAAYNDNEELVITVIAGGSLENAAMLYLEYDAVDPTKVTSADIIGGASMDGKTKGLELVDSIYTKFGDVPGILAAPGYTEDPEVASVMKAKALNICGLFRCIILTDVDTKTVKNYQDVNEWKNKNSYTGANQVVCWPCIKNGDTVYHFSTHLLGVIGVLDSSDSDVPYQSPSNQPLQATGACLADGTEINLSLPQATMINGQGIMTALNFSGGWKTFGNYTGIYPSSIDPKDCFICVRRMFDWQYQVFILTYWKKLDNPLRKRLIDNILDSEMVRLNSLVARGYLLGASIQFNEDENPTTDLLAGIIRFHTKITPPVPAQEIDNTLEYDVDSFKALFA